MNLNRLSASTKQKLHTEGGETTVAMGSTPYGSHLERDAFAAVFPSFLRISPYFTSIIDRIINDCDCSLMPTSRRLLLMATLKDVFRCEISAHAKRGRLDKQDLEHDVLVRIAEQENVPAPVLAWLRGQIRKTAQASTRRETRRKSRMRPLADFGSEPVEIDRTNHVEQVIVEDLVRVATVDAFDADAIQAMRGKHDEFESFSEFAKAQTECSKSEAYRRRNKLQKRIESLALIED